MAVTTTTDDDEFWAIFTWVSAPWGLHVRVTSSGVSVHVLEKVSRPATSKVSC